MSHTSKKFFEENIKMNRNKDKGDVGELTARKYLTSVKNMRILKNNYHSRYGEIDIISCTDKYIVFVEVKTRKKESLYRGAEAVDKNKRIKIIKTAMMFLSENNIDLQPRFDVVEVTNFKNKESQIIHFENAFDIGECDEIF